MRKKVIAALIVTASIYGGMLTYERVSAADLDEGPMSLEGRVALCLGTDVCPVEEKVQLTRELHARMDALMDQASASCRSADIARCISRRTAAMDKWHELDDSLERVAKSIEVQNLAAQEPAAGMKMPRIERREEKSWYEFWLGRDE